MEAAQSIKIKNRHENPQCVKEKLKKRKRDHFEPNGLTYASAPLSAALHFFAGGSVLDIALVCSITPSEAYFSAWKVVDSARSTSSLNIDFPRCHAKQKEIACDFEAISAAGFNNCCGCIDGLLIWITKPNCNESSHAKVGVKNFFVAAKANLALICKEFEMLKVGFSMCP